ncbi:hypothetical protein GLOIN_2v1770441 [Rhizophagus irregularis DAOM 181602=DAOM 197198]|nr:hypothetical protein GLOIN_2v1770441 [Rhizophagus irregularis DAOM 181602=DAOM 197198]
MQSISIGYQEEITFTNICQNITNLEINECDKDTIGLASFIETQKNLQSSLSLHFDNVEGQYTLLNNIIRKKAATLKKVTIQPIITLISPIFIPSLLKNIQYLALIILIMNMKREDATAKKKEATFNRQCKKLGHEILQSDRAYTPEVYNNIS